MKVLHLRERIPWFGGHSGYEQLTRHFSPAHAAWTVTPRDGRLARYSGSTYARMNGHYGQGAGSLSELEFRMRRWLRRPDASHILYLEHHFALLGTWTERQKDLIGTIHLPSAIWKPDQCQLLSRLKVALVLFKKDIPFFEQYLGKGRIEFIHHGADTEFFTPDPSKITSPLRVLYSGVYLRNESMFVRVLKRLVESNPELRFDLLVPEHHRKSPTLAPLLKHPAVTWHAGLNDEQLRALYQKCYLMLLPMNDSGANTAVVEALTSGLPLVTTDVGGIRDYAGGDIYPIVTNNDDDRMVDLVEKYLVDPIWRGKISQQCRRFAEEKLAWPIVVEKHLQTYMGLMG